MADAKKCDRCGVFYSPYLPGKGEPDLNGVDFMIFSRSNKSLRKRFELCPGCAKYISAVMYTPPDLPAKQ